MQLAMRIYRWYLRVQGIANLYFIKMTSSQRTAQTLFRGEAI